MVSIKRIMAIVNDTVLFHFTAIANSETIAHPGETNKLQFEFDTVSTVLYVLFYNFLSTVNEKHIIK